MTGQQIRRQLKKSFDRIRNEKYKQNLLQAIPFWVASLLTGLIAVFYSRIFAFLEGETFSIIGHYKWLIFILTPLCFFLAWWVVVKFAPYARGSGIPQVMAAIELANPGYNKKVEKLLSVKIFFVKFPVLKRTEICSCAVKTTMDVKLNFFSHYHLFG